MKIKWELTALDSEQLRKLHLVFISKCKTVWREKKKKGQGKNVELNVIRITFCILIKDLFYSRGWKLNENLYRIVSRIRLSSGK